MERSPMLLDWILIIKLEILQKEIYRFNAIPIKILTQSSKNLKSVLVEALL